MCYLTRRNKFCLFRFFIKDKKSITRRTVPPLSQKKLARLICSLASALTTFRCRYHFFASTPSASSFTKSLLLSHVLSQTLIGFCRSILCPAALCLHDFYTIFEHYPITVFERRMLSVRRNIRKNVHHPIQDKFFIQH